MIEMTKKKFKEGIKQYNDIVRGIKDLNRRIIKMRSESKDVIDSVKGSSPTFPYTEHTCIVRGTEQSQRLRRREKLLETKKKELEELRDRLEQFINIEIPNERIRQILQYRYIDGFSWVKIAFRMEGKATEESVRKELERFLKNF